MNQERKNKGFTLAELLIVVAIIAVLVGISIPIFTSQVNKAKLAVDQANVRSAKAAAAAEYMTDGESGEVSYLYDGGKAVKINSNNITLSGNGYGKSDSYEGTGAVSGTPKNGYVEVTIDDSQQITAHWVSSAKGAVILATGTYTYTDEHITKKSLIDDLEKMGVDPKEVTTFVAGPGTDINETAEAGNGNRINNGVLIDTFAQFPNLKKIDLSQATLETGNINLFRGLPSSVQEIKLPKSKTAYDIRGTWYYAGGQQTDSARNDTGANAEDSRITEGHDGQTIYRTKELAEAAGRSSTN